MTCGRREMAMGDVRVSVDASGVNAGKDGTKFVATGGVRGAEGGETALVDSGRAGSVLRLFVPSIEGVPV